MTTGADVLRMLIPQGGYYIAGDEYENIQFIECEPISKTQFEAGFAQYVDWKANQDSAKAANKAALLDRLGITEDEARLLLS
jgi:hypothetical protein